MTESAAAIQQHVVQTQALGFEKRRDALHAFGLVDEQEGQVGTLFLSVFQHRHFPTAWRAPGRPQVDHQRATLIIAELMVSPAALRREMSGSRVPCS